MALENGKTATVSGNKKACIKNVEILDAAGKKIQNLEVGKKIKLKVTVLANENLPSLVLGYQIKNRFSQVVYGTNTYHLKQALKNETDIVSTRRVVDRLDRKRVSDTDNGVKIKKQIEVLKLLLEEYREGTLVERF